MFYICIATLFLPYPVILVALLTQKKTVARAMDAGTSTWELVKSYRPVPTELRGLREVNAARLGLLGLAVLLKQFAPIRVKPRVRNDLGGLVQIVGIDVAQRHDLHLLVLFEILQVAPTHAVHTDAGMVQPSIRRARK